MGTNTVILPVKSQNLVPQMAMSFMMETTHRHGTCQMFKLLGIIIKFMNVNKESFISLIKNFFLPTDLGLAMGSGGNGKNEVPIRQPEVQGTKAFWVVNFKNKLIFIVEQVTDKRAFHGGSIH